MGDSLPWTPTNRSAKFDAASFIIGWEIRKRTKKQTNTQTVTDISTPCLSASVDNNNNMQIYNAHKIEHAWIVETISKNNKIII